MVQVLHRHDHICYLLQSLSLREGQLFFLPRVGLLRPRVWQKSPLFSVNVKTQTQVRCQRLGLFSTQCCFNLGKGGFLVPLTWETQISALSASVSLPPALVPSPPYTQPPMISTFFHNIPDNSLSTYYVPDTFLVGPGDTAVNKSHCHSKE